MGGPKETTNGKTVFFTAVINDFRNGAAAHRENVCVQRCWDTSWGPTGLQEINDKGLGVQGGPAGGLEHDHVPGLEHDHVPGLEHDHDPGLELDHA